MRSLAALTALTTAVNALSFHSNDPNNHVVRRALHHERAQAHSGSGEGLSGRMHRRVRRQDASKLSTSSSSSTSGSKTYTTTAIWYAESGWITACGETLTDDAYFVGLPLELYPNVGEKSALCGKTVVATNAATGVNITATILDASNRQDYTIFSPSAFTALGGVLETGELDITFSLVDAGDVVIPSSSSSAAAGSTTSAAAAKKTPSAGGLASTAGSDNTQKANEGVADVANAANKVVKTTTTTAAPTTQAPQTTEAPKTTTTSAWDSEAYYASSSSSAAAAAASAEAQKKEEAASQEAYQLWAASSTSAAQAAASSKSAADAAWASSSSAAAAAASKSSADAAWASSSSSAAAAAAAKPTADSNSGSDSGSSSSGSSKVYSGGIATFFYQNGNPGNCGTVNPDSLPLVALPTNTYAGGAHCGKYVTIKRTDTGNTIRALVADSCPTCNNDSCLDLSWGAFSGLGGTVGMGVFDITWWFD